MESDIVSDLVDSAPKTTCLGCLTVVVLIVLGIVGIVDLCIPDKLPVYIHAEPYTGTDTETDQIFEEFYTEHLNREYFKPVEDKEEAAVLMDIRYSRSDQVMHVFFWDMANQRLLTMRRLNGLPLVRTFQNGERCLADVASVLRRNGCQYSACCSSLKGGRDKGGVIWVGSCNPYRQPELWGTGLYYQRSPEYQTAGRVFIEKVDPVRVLVRPGVASCTDKLMETITRAGWDICRCRKDADLVLDVGWVSQDWGTYRVFVNHSDRGTTSGLKIVGNILLKTANTDFVLKGWTITGTSPPVIPENRTLIGATVDNWTSAYSKDCELELSNLLRKSGHSQDE